MKYDSNVHHRQSIRLKEYDYSQPGAYFVTLVTKDKTNLFGEIAGDRILLNDIGKFICSTWQRLPKYFPIRHDEWVIMPNHLHGIIWILDTCKGEASANPVYKAALTYKADASPLPKPLGTQPRSLGAIVQNFKSVSTRKIHKWLLHLDQGEVIDNTVPAMVISYLSNASPLQVWQRNYFERVIRNGKELDRIRKYIINNPREWTEDKEYHPY